MLAACLLAAFCFAACSPEQNAQEQDPEKIDISTVDATTPILTIGEEKISFAIYKALYDSYLPYMQSAGYDPLSTRSSLESFQDWLVDSLAKDLVVLYQAGQNLKSRPTTSFRRSTIITMPLPRPITRPTPPLIPAYISKTISIPYPRPIPALRCLGTSTGQSMATRPAART